MLILVLGLLAQPGPAEYEPPDEYAILYGNDMVWAQFSRYWEDAYDTSRSAFMTAQGSHDMPHWYQRHRAKMELDFARVFSLRYRIDAHYDFEVAEHRHRVEPMIRLGHGFRFHLMIAPLFEKEDDEIGAGLSWTGSGRKNWLEFYTVLEHFDHNNILRHVSAGPNRDPYSPIPLRFEVDARGELPWVKARLHGELGTRSRQYLDWPDFTWEVWERFNDHQSAWGRLEVKPLKDLWLGTRFSWNADRSLTRWLEQDTGFVDTLLEGWISPYVSFSPTDRLELYVEHRLWSLYRNMDSLTYQRDFDVTTFQASWQPFRFMVLHAGYQYSWRERFINDSLIAEPWRGSHAWPRLMFNFEFRFPSGFMFVVKEGLRMWEFPSEIFRRFHAHTYVQFYIPLDIVDRLGKEDKE
jgi:hypothetical protein